MGVMSASYVTHTRPVLLLLRLGNRCPTRIKFINLDNAIVPHLNPPVKHRIYISLVHSLSFFKSLA